MSVDREPKFQTLAPPPKFFGSSTGSTALRCRKILPYKSSIIKPIR